MNYYKKDNAVWAFEDDQLELVTNEFVKMTGKEVDQHLNPSKYWSSEERKEHNAPLQLALAETEYDRASEVLRDYADKIADSDFGEGETADTLEEYKNLWTDYRIALRGYIKTGDGRNDLPVSPDNSLNSD